MRRAVIIALGIALFVVSASAFAFASDDADLSGTYTGTVTTSSGRNVPVTAYLVDNGDTVDVTLEAEGYSASTVGRVTRSGDSAQIQATVNAPGVLKGSGTATVIKQGDSWKADGSGSGTALSKYSGTASGSVQRVATDFGGAAGTGAVTLGIVAAADPVAAVVAPADPQPPMSDTERVAAAGGALAFALLLLLSMLFMGSPEWVGPSTLWL